MKEFIEALCFAIYMLTIGIAVLVAENWNAVTAAFLRMIS
jgi:hypothetical protein